MIRDVYMLKGTRGEFSEVRWDVAASFDRSVLEKIKSKIEYLLDNSALLLKISILKDNQLMYAQFSTDYEGYEEDYNELLPVKWRKYVSQENCIVLLSVVSKGEKYMDRIKELDKNFVYDDFIQYEIVKVECIS